MTGICKHTPSILLSIILWPCVLPHLLLGVHLQDVHHIDGDVPVGLLILAHPQGH